MKDAINEALAQEMAADDRVVLFGEDIAGGAGRDDVYPEAADAWGGPFGVTKGLLGKLRATSRHRHGDRRDRLRRRVGRGGPIAGLRPVAEIMYVDFIGTSFDQLLNQAAKLRYVYGGKVSVPLVVRTVVGAGFRAGAEHSQTLYSLYTHVPGLKVVAPSTAYDAKGLLIAAIRDPDPVIFIEHKRLYMRTSPCRKEPYVDSARRRRIVRRGGRDDRRASRRWSTRRSMPPRSWHSEGISGRGHRPADATRRSTPTRSSSRCARRDTSSSSTSRIRAARSPPTSRRFVAPRAFDVLRRPVRQVTGAHSPVPFSPPLEDLYIPSAARVADACRSVVGYTGSSRPLSTMATTS